MSAKPGERIAFSPGEFAALFGKSQTWGYRQIYAGKVKPVTEYGRILIPAAEVDRILATAGVYDGKKAASPKTKAEIQKLKPKLGDAWKKFLSKSSASKKDSKSGLFAFASRKNSATEKDSKKSPLSRFSAKAKR